MKLSPYHVYVSHYLDEGLCILYSTVSDSAVCIHDYLYHRLLSGLALGELSGLPMGLTNVLRKYFLIHDEEKHRLEILNRIEESVFSRKRFALTVLTTSHCNFSCLYCYQNGVLERNKNMSPKTVSFVLAWLSKQLETVRPQAVELHLYGGEPLVNPSALWAILYGARESSKRLGIRFGAYVTTNGYLLTPDTARRLANEGVQTALVSLDGPPEMHDSRRPLANDRGTFHRILNNIRLAPAELNICIRVNLDKQNSETIPELFSILARENLQNRVLIDLEVISPILFPSPHVQRFLLEGDDDLRSIEHLWEKCAEYGFRIFGAMPIEGACEHKSVNTYTVDPEGQLYECPGFVGLPAFRIGNVKNCVDMPSPRSGQVNRPWLECGDCPYLPICQGGCRMCNYVTKGELQSPFCKRNFFHRTYPSFLKAKYAHELRVT